MHTQDFGNTLGGVQCIDSVLRLNPTFIRSGSGREPYSRGQWDSALRAPRKPPGVMLKKAGACTQPVRSGAHGFRSHGPR
jgi:hypothetical protein